MIPVGFRNSHSAFRLLLLILFGTFVSPKENPFGLKAGNVVLRVMQV